MSLLNNTHNFADEWDKYPLLDTDKILSSFNNDKALMYAVLETLFKQELPIDLKELDEARVAGDLARIAEIIHKIKGGAMYCGTTQLKHACIFFENKLVDYTNTANNLDLLMAKFLDTCQATQLAIKSLLKVTTKS